MTTTLVLGGVRSGKSRYAERLLADAPSVLYVATAPAADPDDPAWAARVEAHRARRPGHWQTAETLDLAGTIRSATTPVLVDCLGVWLSRVVDEAHAWVDLDTAAAVLAERADDLLDAWRAAPVDVVLVTNEVGLGVVPDTPSGRFFRDQLGSLNARLSAEADRVYLVAAGRVLDLSDAPVVD